MVALTGCYYGAPFKGSRGVTEDNMLSPTILNTVVGAVICHWETVVVVEEAGTEVFGGEVQKLAMLFYADDRILASSLTARLQETLNVLTGLFGCVRLRVNVNNAVRMNFQPCCTAIQ